MTIDIKLIVGSIGLILSTVVALLWERGEKFLLKKRLGSRKEINIEEQLCLKKNKDWVRAEVILILKEIAAYLNISPAQLRLTDRFDKEFAPIKGFEFDGKLSPLYRFLAKKIKEKNKKIDIQQIKTLKDILDVLCSSDGSKTFG